MAANKERGELPLTLGDETYILKLTTNAVCEMETASGRTFDQMMARMQQGSMTDLRFFLWAMLQEKQPDLTLLAVGDLIDVSGGVVGIQEQLEKLVKLNTKEAKTRGTNGNPRKAQPGTGGSSTSTPAALA